MPFSDPEKQKEYLKKYRAEWAKRPENVEKLREKARKYQSNRPKEDRSAEWAAWYSKNKNVYKALRAAQRNRDAEYGREIKRQYGLTREELRERTEACGGKCEICGKANASRALHVDHDHRTGFVRGLLCKNCNNGLGMFADRVDLLANAISYLRAARRDHPSDVWQVPPRFETKPLRTLAFKGAFRNRVLYKKHCPQCGGAFESIRSDAKYCSPKCCTRFSNAIARERNLNAPDSEGP